MKEEKPKHDKSNKHPHPEVAEARDTITQYLLNPRGEIDGLLLNSGMFVKFARPHPDKPKEPKAREVPDEDPELED